MAPNPVRLTLVQIRTPIRNPIKDARRKDPRYQLSYLLAARRKQEYYNSGTNREMLILQNFMVPRIFKLRTLPLHFHSM